LLVVGFQLTGFGFSNGRGFGVLATKLLSLPLQQKKASAI